METVKAIVTDNLITRNGGRTPASELPAVVALLNQGVNTIDDHWPTVRTEWGTILDAELRQLTGPYPLSLSPDNQAIIDSEGYYFILATVQIKKPEILADIDRDLGLGVSLGFMVQRLTCPGCDCGESIWDCRKYDWRDPAPFIEYRGIIDVIELSRVAAPAVRLARLLKDERTEGQVQSK